MQGQVSSGRGSHGMDLCIYPRVSAVFGFSLTFFISVSSCHIGTSLSLLMLRYPCPAGSSLEWYMEDIWLKSSFIPMVTSNMHSHSLAVPTTRLPWFHYHVFSLLPSLSNSLISFSDWQRKHVHCLRRCPIRKPNHHPPLHWCNSNFKD